MILQHQPKETLTHLEIKSFDFESKKKTETLSRWFEKVRSSHECLTVFAHPVTHDKQINRRHSST